MFYGRKHLLWEGKLRTRFDCDILEKYFGYTIWGESLRELHLHGNNTYFKFTLNRITKDCPFADKALFPKLNKLSVRFHISSLCLYDSEMVVTLKAFLDVMNEHLGVKGHLESVLVGKQEVSCRGIALCNDDVWFWKAPMGKSFSMAASERRRLDLVENQTNSVAQANDVEDSDLNPMELRFRESNKGIGNENGA
jgi:hypothetical protein